MKKNLITLFQSSNFRDPAREEERVAAKLTRNQRKPYDNNRHKKKEENARRRRARGNATRGNYNINHNQSQRPAHPNQNQIIIVPVSCCCSWNSSKRFRLDFHNEIIHSLRFFLLFSRFTSRLIRTCHQHIQYH